MCQCANPNYQHDCATVRRTVFVDRKLAQKPRVPTKTGFSHAISRDVAKKSPLSLCLPTVSFFPFIFSVFPLSSALDQTRTGDGNNHEKEMTCFCRTSCKKRKKFGLSHNETINGPACLYQITVSRSTCQKR